MIQGHRRLAAVMFTDMVGYTALGQRNESLALALVEEQRKVIRPVLSRHDGREVKTIGDAFLVEFPSALEAVRCAYDIQRATREFNVSLSVEKRIHLRVGVHVGDVVESQGDISGDAVNVASRIEPLSEDGGVCLTRQVYDQVQNKLELPLVSIGMKRLKNVSKPVEVFKMVMPWEQEAGLSPAHLDARRVAILPFANMSPDPNDSFFTDGMTEEIISTVSSIGGLSVISRTSVMGYKETTKKVGEIGSELRAGSILEGSFRKVGNRIRITTQLIDANNDSHVWAQNYDRELDDVFAVQSDIAKRVADALRVKILPDERRRIERAPTSSTEAFTLYLRGRHYWNERTEEGVKTAIRYFEKALEKDPGYALAYVGIADCYTILVGLGYLDLAEVLPKAEEYLRRALDLDDEVGEAHATLGALLTDRWGWEEAEEEFQRALALNPSYATAHHWYSLLLADTGRLREGLDEIEKACQLDPNSLIILSAKGVILYYMHDYAKSIEVGERVLMVDPDFVPGLANLFGPLCEMKMFDEAATLVPRYVSLVKNPLHVLSAQAVWFSRLGRLEEARKALEETERLADKDHTLTMVVARAHLQLGEVDEAFEWLDKAADQKCPDLCHAKVEPEFDAVRGDARFGALLKRVGLA